MTAFQAAGVISAVSVAWYVVAAYRGDGSRAAWTIWAASEVTVFVTQYARGARGELLLQAPEVAGAVVICVLTWRRADGSVGRREAALFGIVALALAWWVLTDDATVAIVLGVGVGLAGLQPTLAGAWRGREPAGSWLLIAAAGAITAAAIPRAAPAVLYLYPASLVLMGAAVTGTWTAGTLTRDPGRHAAPRHWRAGRPVAAVACAVAAGLAAAGAWQVVTSGTGIPPADIAQAAVRPSPAPAPLVTVPPSRHRTVLPPVVPAPSLASPVPVPGAVSPPAGEAPAPATSPYPSPAVSGPSPSPRPTPAPTPLPSLSVSPSPSPDPTPTPTPSTTYPSPTVSPTPAYTATPTPSPS